MIEAFWNLLSKKLSGEASAEELRQLEDMMQKHPELHYPVEHIQDLWSLSAGGNNSEAEHAYLKHLQNLKEQGIDMSSGPKQFRRYGGRILAGSLATAALIVASLFVFNRESVPEKKLGEVSTQHGSRSKMVLPDGSRVWLNAGSKISFGKRFGVSSREVNLEGEAFFDVVHDKARPFVIQTSSVEIRVMGTVFNVKCYPEDRTTETSIVSGRVEIIVKNRPQERFVLNAHEKLVVANATDSATLKNRVKKDPIVVLDQVTYLNDDTTIIETLWVDDKLVFRDESFSQLAKKMERWYDVNISIADAQLQQTRFTGIFSNETIEQALLALQITSDFDFKILDKQITITKTNR